MRAAPTIATVSAQLARLWFGKQAFGQWRAWQMADVINLRIARKRMARKKAEDRAAERRLAHGASKAERDHAATDRDKAHQTLDQHRIEPGDRR